MGYYNSERSPERSGRSRTMKKVFAFISAVFFSVLITHNFITHNSYAQYGQPAPSYSILVDKMVNKGNEYVDNLSPTDPRFRPGQTVSFKVKIKNTANVKLTNVVLKDFVPLYIEPIEGPGSYDLVTRTITYNPGDFEPSEEKVYYIKGQIFSQDKLPSDKGLFCLVNKVTASTDQVSDDDASQFCIEKQVISAAAVPSAGPQLGLALLAGQLITLGLGKIIIDNSKINI